MTSALTARLHSSHSIVSAVRACVCTSGVSVMPMEYRNSPLSFEYQQKVEQESARPSATIVYVMPVDLPLGQKLAMTRMRRTDLADKLRQAMEQMVLPPVKMTDFPPLRERGYCIQDATGFHRLTPMGETAADEVLRAFAKQLGIHHFTTHSGQRFHYSVRCTCGWSATREKNQGHFAMGVMRMQSRHLQEIEERGGVG